MTDLTQYSENELSLMVFNDEGLYQQRFSLNIVDTLKEFFLFTKEQEDILISDLFEDLNEQ